MRKRDVQITIERVGTFAVGWNHSHNRQCGNVGTNILDFKVKIVARADRTNADGWIIDNNGIPGYFNRKYALINRFQSCEHIAACAVRDFRREIESDGALPDRIEVAVSGIPGSWITATWQRGGMA